jgi:hypothetical protein
MNDFDLNHLTIIITCEFQKVVEYFRANRMELHPKKQCLIFGPNLPEERIQIFLNNNNLTDPQVIFFITLIAQINKKSKIPATNFLGVLFDPKLNFKTHIQTNKNKISKSMYSLKQVKNILSEKAMLSLYFAMIHCHLI